MFTISQLAGYAGVTVAAIRHYHRIGLLSEPTRNSSGYRSYDASAVVQLIRISTLAHAGVPLSQVRTLLEAAPMEFAGKVQEIDERLQEEISRLERTRDRLAKLAAGEELALPPRVVAYLDRLRALGVAESYIEKERDAWIMLTARVPDQIDDIIERKHEDLGDREVRRLYELVSELADEPPEESVVVEAADILARLFARALAAGQLNVDGLDERFVRLLDAFMLTSAPAAERLIALLEERGWKGWNRIERLPEAQAGA